jgi:hypothetical protein
MKVGKTNTSKIKCLRRHKTILAISENESKIKTVFMQAEFYWKSLWEEKVSYKEKVDWTREIKN